MKLITATCVAILTCAIDGIALSAVACHCGPTYCMDQSAFDAAIAAKKSAALADGAPARLLPLYDKLDHCVAAAATSPDGFKILFQRPDGNISVDTWTAENEKNDAASVASSRKGACYVILSRRAFVCCDAIPATQRPDYDSNLDLNTDDAMRCQP